MKPDSMAFETFYSDDSGVEHAVRLTNHKDFGQRIELESVGTVEFPLEKLDWIIGALRAIKEATRQEGAE